MLLAGQMAVEHLLYVHMQGLEDFISFCEHGSSGLGSTSLPITHALREARGEEVGCYLA